MTEDIALRGKANSFYSPKNIYNISRTSSEDA